MSITHFVWQFLHRHLHLFTKLTYIKKDGKYGFADKSGKVVIPSEWKLTDIFDNGLAIVQDNNGKYGFIDTRGRIVIPCQWMAASRFHDGFARVQNNNGKYGFINKNGEWKDIVYPFAFNGLARVQDDNGKWGFVNESREVVIPCQWKDADDFYPYYRYYPGGLAAVQDDNGKWGFIDNTGKLVVSCRWSNVAHGRTSYDMPPVCDDHYGWQAIDKTGNPLDSHCYRE